MLFHIDKAKTSDEGNLTKNKIQHSKILGAFSVEKFGCSLCIGGLEKNGKMARKKSKGTHQLKVMDAKLAE